MININFTMNYLLILFIRSIGAVRIDGSVLKDASSMPINRKHRTKERIKIKRWRWAQYFSFFSLVVRLSAHLEDERPW